MLLVTGGAGFIGSNFVHQYIRNYDKPVIVLDKLTYAANLNNLMDPAYKNNIILKEMDIGDSEAVNDVLLGYKVSKIVNFAAESHVDNSIKNSTPFIQSNIVATENFFYTAFNYHKYLEKINAFDRLRFIHVSTDEVYGSLTHFHPPSHEGSPYAPRSLYSASKAASDHIAMAYYHTHGFPLVLTNCSNNYGPHQHVEKFIPTVITRALRNQKIPVYGDGKNIRDWIYVTDHCDALLWLLREYRPGEQYNIGAGVQINNLDLATKILNIMGKPLDLIEFVEDRKGHDFRYDLNTEKIHELLRNKWFPVIGLDHGLKKTIEWYTKRTFLI